MPLRRIITGGQSGVDRGALDAALASGFPCGGHCPRGRRAEDGPIPQRYPLMETTSRDYGQRTEANVLASDGTLILVLSLPLTGGTLLTHEIASKLNRQCLVLELGMIGRTQSRPDVGEILRWLDQHEIECLNVAGPRESGAPGIGRATFEILSELIKRSVERVL